MAIKVVKAKDGILLSGGVPAELANASEVEIFPLRDGAYLLTLKGFIESKAKAPAQSISLSQKEREVLSKLVGIKFEKRVPKEVDKILSAEEKKVLQQLIEKRVVHIFRDSKYPDGVYSVADAAFNAAKEQQAAAATQETQHPIEQFEKSGWAVIENEKEAAEFGEKYSEEMRSGLIRGIKGFDKKYYVISHRFYQAWQKKVLSALSKNEEKTVDEISAELKLLPSACRCILVHLCNEGEAMERHGGRYIKV
ncbi:MAG: hypothetical protein N3G80_02880 [Candidatus Micrarchaeota archaeon]|nr:hypothetical protein [Candidatus Micrarchaeota archaeon]